MIIESFDVKYRGFVTKGDYYYHSNPVIIITVDEAIYDYRSCPVPREDFARDQMLKMINTEDYYEF